MDDDHGAQAGPVYTQVSIGICLIVLSLLGAVVLGRLYPYAPPPTTLTELVARATGGPELRELWFVLPIAGSATGFVLTFKGRRALWWIHVGALMTVGVIYFARQATA